MMEGFKLKKKKTQHIVTEPSLLKIKHSEKHVTVIYYI